MTIQAIKNKSLIIWIYMRKNLGLKSPTFITENYFPTYIQQLILIMLEVDYQNDHLPIHPDHIWQCRLEMLQRWLLSPLPCSFLRDLWMSWEPKGNSHLTWLCSEAHGHFSDMWPPNSKTYRSVRRVFISKERSTSLC